MTWWTLHHPNVLPLLGATISEGRLAMVSAWMANGDIKEFVNANINTNRLGLVCFPFRKTFACH